MTRVRNFICLATLLALKKQKQRRERRFQVHPLFLARKQKGEFFTLMNQLEKYPIKFFEYFRMTKEQFNFLLSNVENDLDARVSLFRCDIISPKEKLVLTLRFLATGASFADLSFRFLMGKSTVRICIIQTIKALNKNMQKIVLPVPTTPKDWKVIASSFLERWNFPNCLGAVDGKHIRMFAPRKSGSFNFNYKKCFSTILMAVVDANYKFIMVSVGAHGSNADSTVFASSKFGNAWQNEPQKLHVPADIPLPNTGSPIPFVLVGDEAFGLRYNLMTPYPGTSLTTQQRIYNYRLSRARRMVESAFGILAHRWRILLKPLEVQMELAKPLILCCCILHNFLQFTPERITVNDTEEVDSLVDHDTRSREPASNAVNIRKMFSDWFVNQGNVDWQWDIVK